MTTDHSLLISPSEEHWYMIIEPKAHLLDLNLKEVWKYRDLLLLFVKRDFIAQYKQTILGPLWHVIQPVFTTIMFLLVFGKIANIPTDGVAPVLLHERDYYLELFFRLPYGYFKYLRCQLRHFWQGIFPSPGHP